MISRVQKTVLVLVAVLFMVFSNTGSASAGALLADLENALMCKCDDKCGKVLGNCTCSTADKTRKKFSKMLESGLTVEQIVKQQVEEHGETILSAPTKKGFNLTAWIIPFGAILVGGLGLRRLLNVWTGKKMPDNEVDGAADVDTDKPDDAAGSTKYSHRLQDELNQLET
ncbi:MAG: cytochrome c-type biogenesis protein CcmH [Nitrospinaceae bacterium]|jgi:cytochrome c-type biogenesis protein CcmH|nr:cytochrome c-type biogenesis protein CcmH [Nitrospinaceae bacterium]